jgi:hypothetical protein
MCIYCAFDDIPRENRVGPSDGGSHLHNSALTFEKSFDSFRYTRDSLFQGGTDKLDGIRVEIYESTNVYEFTKHGKL